MERITYISIKPVNQMLKLFKDLVAVKLHSDISLRQMKKKGILEKNEWILKSASRSRIQPNT